MINSLTGKKINRNVIVISISIINNGILFRKIYRLSLDSDYLALSLLICFIKNNFLFNFL